MEFIRDLDVPLTAIIILGLLFGIKIVLWRLRIHRFRKSMPVIPVLFPPGSLNRKLWPKKWQKYHYDWYLHSRRKVYQDLNSDIFAFVSLFEGDSICFRDPNVFMETKVLHASEYPKDLRTVKAV